MDMEQENVRTTQEDMPVPAQVNATAVPVQETAAARDPKRGKRKRVFLIVGIALAVVILLIVALTAVSASNQRAKEAYKNDLQNTSLLMITGAAGAEDLGNLVSSVWHNSIYEVFDEETDPYTRLSGGTGGFYQDFNAALSALFTSDEFQDAVSTIQDNQDQVRDMMKKLKNPPAEYEDAYDAMKEFYDAYMEFADFVTNPTGSYQSFSDGFAAQDSAVLSAYRSASFELD